MNEKIDKILRPALYGVLGVLVGATGALSFARTDWPGYKPDFFLWWSIISTMLSFFFICVSIWQYWQGHSQEEKIKAQVKVWMQDADGITNALKGIAMTKYGSEKFSNISDVFHTVNAIQEASSALYQSLYEERCVTEDEYRARQKRKADIIEEQELLRLKGKVN